MASRIEGNQNQNEDHDMNTGEEQQNNQNFSNPVIQIQSNLNNVNADNR